MILRDKFTIHTTRQFKEELNEITFLIKFKLKEPLIANNLYKAVIEGISSLSFMPERHISF